MTYQKCLTWKDVQLTLASNEKAKIVAWPHNQLTHTWLVLVQGEAPVKEETCELLSPELSAVLHPKPRFRDYSGAVWK